MWKKMFKGKETEIWRKVRQKEIGQVSKVEEVKYDTRKMWRKMESEGEVWDKDKLKKCWSNVNCWK